MQKSNIYFIGFMGTGKSTVGPIVANSIDYNFFDLDKEIEKRTNLCIVSIFEQYGEKYFRELEHEILKELIKENKKLVLSLGGGTVKNLTNVELLKKTGIIINLYADIDTLVERLSRKKTRPLLLDENGELLHKEILKEKIRNMLSEREKYYQLADYHIKSEEKLAATVDKIVRIIEEKIFNGKN
ncbi:MAG TPA: shikimate kinase [Ignavibacteriales bacterium]|jgi:shikimate kinase|nr:shikimate kinase [Ignavibacteriales bacterium]